MSVKADKARNLAYKKPLVKYLNFDSIRNEMYDIAEACDEVRYFVEEDENLLYSILGDDDEAYEFKMLFNSLSSDAERFLEDLYYEHELPEMFDDWFCAMNAGDMFGGYIGYDNYEDDYIKLDYENYVETESGKRIHRRTKEDIINSARQCFKIFTCWQSIRSRYNDLQCAFDVLRDNNKSYLQIIRDINDEYEKGEEKYSYSKRFENLISALPDETWLQ